MAVFGFTSVERGKKPTPPRLKMSDSDDEEWAHAEKVATENRKKRDAAASKAASGVVSTHQQSLMSVFDTDLNYATTN